MPWSPLWRNLPCFQRHESIHQDKTPFENLNHRLAVSEHEVRFFERGIIRTLRLADHIYVGTLDDRTQSPVLIARKAFELLTYLVGASGSGKTQLLLRLIFALLLWPEEQFVIILDMKGDEGTDNAEITAMRIAEEVGIPFYFLTLEPDRPSHYFSFLRHLSNYSGDVLRFMEQFLDAANLWYGTSYGASHFSAVNWLGLLKGVVPGLKRTGVDSHEAFLALLDSTPLPLSWFEIYQNIKQARGFQAGSQGEQLQQLESTLLRMMKLPQLGNLEGKPHAEAIDLLRLADQGGIAYFRLNPDLDPFLAPLVGKLVIAAAFLTMQFRAAQRLPKRQGFVVMDEFHILAGQSLSTFLTQARSYHLGLLLANQSISSLKGINYDLTSLVMDNTPIKFYCSIYDQKYQKQLIDSSGEEVTVLRSTQMATQTNSGVTFEDDSWVTGMRTSTSEAERVTTKLTQEDINRTNSETGLAIVHVLTGQAGLCDLQGVPVVLRGDFPLFYGLDEYARHHPWPDIPQDASVPQAQPPVEVEHADEDDGNDTEPPVVVLPPPKRPQTKTPKARTVHTNGATKPAPAPQAAAKPIPTSVPAGATPPDTPSLALEAWYEQQFTPQFAHLVQELRKDLF